MRRTRGAQFGVPSLGVAARRGDGALWIASNYSNRTGYAWNNIHRLFERLAKEWSRRGCPVVLSFSKVEPPIDTIDLSQFDAVIEVAPLPTRFKECLAAYRKLRDRGVRFAYLTDQPAVSWQYVLMRAYGVRRIIVHSRVSVDDPRPAEMQKGIKGFVKWAASRMPLCRVDKIYAVSDFVRNRIVLKARFPAERVFKIMNGIDIDRFSPLPRDADSRDTLVRLFCGCRATERKGVHVLIRALARLRDYHGIDNWILDYAGDGPDLEGFKELARELRLTERVNFLGEVPGTTRLVRESDIVIVPSVWGDACPSSVSEALASGKALIATAVGGVPEIVGEAGAALMVPPESPEAIADSLAYLIQDPEARESLARKARVRAEQALSERIYHAKVVQSVLSDTGVNLMCESEL